MEDNRRQKKEAVNIFQEEEISENKKSEDTEHTKRKGKNPRTKTSAQQSKKVFALVKHANGRTTQRTTQSRKT